ncbi:MAG TPA: ferredoxin [Firmicutes bacterium]|nr:ferredoxin [Bacillota bacterium]
MEAYVNEDCIYCGMCADLCPEVFQLADDRAIVILTEIPPEHEDCCREAAEECPSDAIEVKE